jgi:hypothetical protein
MRPYPLLISGLCLELFSCSTALWADAPTALFFAGHLGASGLCAAGGRQLIPGWARERDHRDLASLFALTFFLPLIGALGVVFGLSAALATPKDARTERPFVTVEEPGLPTFTGLGEVPALSRAAVVHALAGARDEARRVSGVRTAGRWSDEFAIPLLERALKDPSDEVRLLAYALLDGKERIIQAQIEAERERPRTAESDARLAHLHFELVYRGLVRGDGARRALTAALDHANAAGASARHAPEVHLLRGRILIALGRADEAEAALEEAVSRGAAAQTVLPHLAEAAFLRSDWSAVRRRLQALSSVPGGAGRLPQVTSYWTSAPS